MRLTASILVLIGLLLGGCNGDAPRARDAEAAVMFGPASMRIHPIFTDVRDFSGDGRADGVEALLEFYDQFGDPTKARGRVLFELYEYRRGYPDPRGERVGGPWIVPLMTREDQQRRWNANIRTYDFQLEYPRIRTDRPYVLTAVFELSDGGRFFDRMILDVQPQQEMQSAAPADRPTRQPAG